METKLQPVNERDYQIVKDKRNEIFYFQTIKKLIGKQALSQYVQVCMYPVSPVFPTEVTVRIGLINMLRVGTSILNAC